MIDLKSHLVMPGGEPFEERVVEKDKETGETKVISTSKVTLGEMLIRALLVKTEADASRSDWEMLLTYKLGHKIGIGEGEVEFTPDETKLLIRRARIASPTPFVWGAIVQLLAPAMLSADAMDAASKETTPTASAEPYNNRRETMRVVKPGEKASGA